MNGKMKVAVMTGIRQMAFTEKEIPQIRDDEVLVKMEYCGICGSDLHYYEDGRIGDFIVKPPFVLGHEPSGTVVEAGSAVRHLKVGDRVTMEPGKTCGHCEFCRTGRYNLCPDVVFFATPPVPGVMQEYVAHEAALCFKLPDSISTMEGCLIEPFSVGMYAATQGGAEIGQTAVVYGAGCIGLCALLALQARGVNRILVADVLDNRLAKAKELGATEVLNTTKEDPLAKILEFTDGRGADLQIEAAGAEFTTRLSVSAAKKGSTIVLVGYSRSGEIKMPMSLAIDKELTFRTVFRYRHIYPLAIEAVASGKVPLKDIVTNVFDFDDAPEAMERSCTDKAGIVKAVIRY